MKRLYPFDDWFGGDPGADGRVRFVLVAGEHYQCPQSSMCQQLRIAACRRGLRVSIDDQRDRLFVVVASSDRRERVAAEADARRDGEQDEYDSAVESVV